MSTKRIPVNIISGFLGVGKTTAINHILKTKPKDELWAVLINEYGEIGIDGALLASHNDEDDLAIREIAGGCICCTAGLMFQMSLALLLQRYKPDRVLIEPTGIATIDGMLDTLAQPGLVETLDVRSIITLIDPTHWNTNTYRQHETYKSQVETADILLATHADMHSEELLSAFIQDAQDIYPPKQHIGQISNGELDLSLLDLISSPATPTMSIASEMPPSPSPTTSGFATVKAPTPTDRAPRFPYTQKKQPHNAYRHTATHDAQTCGWTFAPETVFDIASLATCLEHMASVSGFLRLKGVFRTTTGWWSYNITPTQETIGNSSYRRDSRVEVITTSNAMVNWSALSSNLQECIVNGSTPHEPTMKDTTSQIL